MRDYLPKGEFTRPEERLELAAVLDCVDACMARSTPVFSGFIDPAQRAVIMDVLAKRAPVNALAFGGYDDAERALIGVAPDWCVIERDMFPLAVAELAFKGQLARRAPEHRDFLGAVLSLGIDRKNVGDIVVSHDVARVVLHEKIADFVAANLDKVANVGVKVTLIRVEDAFFPVAIRAESVITLPSLRLDALVSGAFRLSRSESCVLVDGDKVYVNWLAARGASRAVKEGDVISVRGFGRVQVIGIEGATKKGGIALRVCVY